MCDGRHFSLREHGFEFVRNDAHLRGWLAKEDTDLYVLAAGVYRVCLHVHPHAGGTPRTQRQFSALQEQEVKNIVEGIIRERDIEGVAGCTRAVLSSVIYRNPTEDASYANMVHRYLSCLPTH